MIDSRPHAAVEGATRRERVECAVREFKTRCNTMLARNADFKTTGQLYAELHQNASIALLHNALTGDGVYGRSLMKSEKRGSKKQQVYLHEAIKRAQKMRMEDPMNEQDEDVSLCCDALLSNFLIAAVMCEFEDDASMHPLLSQLTSLEVPVLTDERFKPLASKTRTTNI